MCCPLLSSTSIRSPGGCIRLRCHVPGAVVATLLWCVACGQHPVDTSLVGPRGRPEPGASVSSLQPRKGSLSCSSLKVQDGRDPVWGSGSPVCTEAGSEGGVRCTLSSRILPGPSTCCTGACLWRALGGRPLPAKLTMFTRSNKK